MSRPCSIRSVFATVALVAIISCDREERGFQVDPPAADSINTITTSGGLHAGAADPSVGIASTQPMTRPATGPTTHSTVSARTTAQSGPRTFNEYERNAHALSEGKRLYSAYNCVGCHAHGGGDKGPALMDAKWIYGSDSDQIFATIVQGRPNGMPSFRDKVPDYQVWQIVAYVRSMSGLVPMDAAPGRDDHMKSAPPENSMDPEKPVPVSSSPSP